ncbi:profilin-1-like [Pyxicephalus adspersus]|uniref:Profilin n=1 Tax=Pyxicephalus adspersus TaxID=30357 RepID=A0AAV3B2X9_PYXAD|nr:TPA: hypothetical protein GDO54_005806 [Pyxicephalus adspersus]
MSWNDYINNFVDGTVCTDAVILSLSPPHGVWAGHSSGNLCSVTAQEITPLISKDRNQLFINGIVLGGVKCSVLRDLWNEDSQQCLDARTKSSDGGTTFNIHMVRTNQAIVILKGGNGIHGGQLSQKCFDTIKYLRGVGY